MDRKLEILEKIDSLGSVKTRELAEEIGIPISHSGRYLRHYWKQGLLKRDPEIMDQGGVRYVFSLSSSGKKLKNFLKNKK